MAQRYRVTVTQTHAVDVVAEDRDGAAEAALAEVTRPSDSLTHSGAILHTEERVLLVLAERPAGVWAVA